MSASLATLGLIAEGSAGSRAPVLAKGLAYALAAVVRVPFTGALLAALLLGSSAPEVTPIAVLAAAIGWIVTITLPNPEDRNATSVANETAEAQ